jgi:thiol peroxidase
VIFLWQEGERMNLKTALICFTLVFAFVLGGCATLQPKPPVDRESVNPGTSVSRGGKALALVGTPISKGKPLPSVALVDAMTMKDVDLSQEKGQILFLSIVPSVDTKVCEAQTHYLGEEGDRLTPSIQRITISRDLPFAQKRFAEEAKLTDLRYLSDYKTGDFGKATGLLIDEMKLLARAVVIVDREGLVQYIQVVPEITHLPDMEAAFEKAIELSKEK